MARLFGPGSVPLVPAGGWAAWLVILAAAVMAFLAVLALAAGLAAASLGAEWRAELSGSATVRVGGDDDAGLAAVLEILAGTEGIAAARALEREEQSALLAPWLGDGAALSELPIPRLIDVTLEGRGPDAASLAAALEAAAPGSVYDDHAAWRGPLISAAAAIEWLAFAASALVALAAAGMVALAARASLAGNTGVVRVIRLIGGQDRFIARAFIRPILWRTGTGAALGAGAAAALLALLPGAGNVVGLDLAPGGGRLLGLALAVPPAAALIGWAAAAVAVRAALRELP